jgi:hypothetical protein
VTLIGVEVQDWDWDWDWDRLCRFSEAGTEEASTVCWVVGFGVSHLSRVEQEGGCAGGDRTATLRVVKLDPAWNLVSARAFVGFPGVGEDIVLTRESWTACGALVTSRGGVYAGAWLWLT